MNQALVRQRQPVSVGSPTLGAGLGFEGAERFPSGRGWGVARSHSKMGVL